jgi:hypothetical protein
MPWHWAGRGRLICWWPTMASTRTTGNGPASKTKKTVYKPIPRDRDQSFTLWNGTLTYLTNREWAVPSIEGFQAEFGDLKSLNWPARHLDRFLLQSLNREQWQGIARYLQGRITPAAVDEATSTLPSELEPLSGNELNRKLKARIKQLPKALDAYYLLLARRVDWGGAPIRPRCSGLTARPTAGCGCSCSTRPRTATNPTDPAVRPHVFAQGNRGSKPLRPRWQERIYRNRLGRQKHTCTHHWRRR